ncbi:cobalamin trafficking protein CblD-like isoform X5 [Dreissena polymorpha]|uniref:cobalamin trafficking protein CblD-like isoform X1 n=1 Tax=Dreissena polymorpha TaxID=45954 RepID=UPI002264DAB6|nr:cobalamin trafficking protein CblD-like isoform X1 [Dreissena polymorpha]XP_052258352.1 cobalamin trafficking protein CblD-like isoform X2 [Dreissena polymorpha]XP_052258363.1 cobalamin trafficking protein CblD-like isoform X3 [Dreissena polymorpha]XP_052258385.1 cobalamin trafficking protein CblD-like isoform X5 [Dreissena polymorpha]
MKKQMNQPMLSRRIMFLPNLGAAIRHVRAFSWQRSGENTEILYKVVGDTDTGNYTVWPDKKLGPFGPQDSRFPFPGNVGHTLESPSVARNDFLKGPRAAVNTEAIFELLPDEHRGKILTQACDAIEAMDEASSPSPDDLLECVAYDCPHFIRKDFADLFPEKNIMSGPFTVITISQKTKQDMTGWSEEVEKEREQLLKAFVEGASDICEALQCAGFWADFIEPSCGKPFLGEHTNASLYETDERYRKLGFEIEDLGCCKVIRHHVWGTHAYVGCLFTNAPASHPILALMKRNS